jgi:leader peptidase (prepilin peptidase)/N-methyltransferase
MIGAATGVKGVFFSIIVSSLIGAAAGIVIMSASKSTDPKLKIPFGPYLSLPVHGCRVERFLW